MSGIKKAIAAAIVACGTGIGVIAVSPDSIGTKQILVVIGGTLVAFGTTWKVTNDVN
jgi:hypothetical protein